jgi:hypothetical protein
MTSDQSATIGNAGEIINRFGGIRPMSSKTGIPVTTIQGWKQRNAIPSNRRYELIEAANKHGINLSDLLMDMVGEKEMDSKEEIVMQVGKMEAAKLNPDLRPAGSNTVLIAAGALILAAAVFGVVLAIAPKVKDLTEQETRIQELEQQITAMRDAQNSVPASTPEVGSKLSDLEGKIGALTEQAKSYGTVINDLQTGTMGQRLAKLEGHVGGLLQQANAFGLQDALQKVQMMQSSPDGLGQVDGLVASFLGVAQTSKSPDDMAAAFAELKKTDPRVADTFANVAPEDMKAAVMLLGMSQLRDSLARNNNSFDNDLQLLKMTLAKDDPQLQEAIERLAPQAKSGVLTPNGLSKELRGLTGDIVEASLMGQDISIEDKAKARFGQMVMVEKNGVQISGTPTQITIAEAQKKLDTGDVAGAVALLQTVQGPAAEKTKPLINQAQATLMASQVQQLLGQNLIQKLKGLGGSSAPYLSNGGGVNQIVNEIKTLGGGVGQ